MMNLEVTLMNYPKVCMNGEKVSFPYRKAEGLFYYLCMNSSISRDEAIGILWADNDEKSARKNLRDALYNIRKVLGNDVLNIDGNTSISLNTNRVLSVDVMKLNDENMMSDYEGEFLQYFYIRNCLEFESWAEGVRDELKRRYIQAVRRTLGQIKKGAEQDDLEKCGTILLNNRIWEEDIYRQVMTKYAEIGKYNLALELYQRLCEAMREDLDAEVEAETVQLADMIHMTKNRLKENVLESGEYFYGRMDLVYDFLSRIQEDSAKPKSYLITGEAGVGKSMVMKRLQRMLNDKDYISFYWRCYESEQELYLKPWYNVITQIQEYCEDRNISKIPSLELMFQQNASDMQFYFTRFEVLTESVLRFLLGNFKNKKIILFFDDIHWMDETSRKLLMNLLFRMGNVQLILFAACREDYLEEMESFKIPLIRSHLLEEIEIYRFTREETRNIIQECRPELALDAQVVEQIYGATLGNALFLMEWLRSIPEDGKVDKENLTLKSTSVILSRLMNLSPEEMNLLVDMSMMSEAASIRDLIGAFHLDGPETVAVLERLLAKRLIREMPHRDEIRYGFTHLMIWEYVYNSQSEAKRKVYHARIAAYYESQYRKYQDLNMYSSLIYHYEQCGDTYKVYWYKVEYLSAFYSVRHEVYPTIADNVEVESLRDSKLTGEDKLVELAEEIRGLRPVNEQTEDLRMRIEYIIGRYDLFYGDYKHALRSIGKSIELALKANDRDYLYKNYLQMIFYGIQISDTDMMDTYVGKAMRLLQGESYNPEKSCVVSRLNGLYMLKVGRHEEGIAILEDTIAQLEVVCERDSSYRQGMAVCYNYLGEEELRYNKLEAAYGYFEKAIQASTKGYMTSGLGIFYTNAGIALYGMEDYQKAEQYISRAIECFERSKSIWGYARAEAYAALIDLKKGNLMGAMEHCRIAREKGRQIGNPKSLEIVTSVQKQIEKNM